MSNDIPNLSMEKDAAADVIPPKVYFNGFAIGIGNADITLRLHNDEDHISELKLSFQTAKSLAMGLVGALKELEGKLGSDVLTSFEVAQKLGQDLTE